MLTLRYVVAAALAAAVTVALFFQMQALITMRAQSEQERADGKVIDFIRLKRESEVETRKRRMPKKAEVDEPPPVPELDLDLSRTDRPDQGANLAAFAPNVDLSLNMAGGPNLGAAPSDSDIIPMVRVNPQYPLRAMDRGIEGWVEVEFTISATGTVKGTRVVDSKPGSIFNRAALRAIRKWKYKPRIENGVAVERPGVRVRLTFEIEDE